MTKLIRVRDLRDGDNGGDRPSLHCAGECGGVYSADASDYWNLPGSHVMRCCGEPMLRLARHVSYVEA